jgi:hypothetical protein
MVYLTTMSVSQTLRRRMAGLDNTELERMWKEAVESPSYVLPLLLFI